MKNGAPNTWPAEVLALLAAYIGWTPRKHLTERVIRWVLEYHTATRRLVKPNEIDALVAYDEALSALRQIDIQYRAGNIDHLESDIAADPYMRVIDDVLSPNNQDIDHDLRQQVSNPDKK